MKGTGGVSQLVGHETVVGGHSSQPLRKQWGVLVAGSMFPSPVLYKF